MMLWRLRPGPGYAWSRDRDARGLLVGPSPLPALPALPPIVDNCAMEKHAAGSTALVIFDALHIFNNLFMQYIQCLMIALQWWHVREIQNVRPEPRTSNIDLWHRNQ